MRQLTCIVCPNGCTLNILETDGSLSVTGHRCPRGETFAKAELTAPMRSVTTTVRTKGLSLLMLPVHTSGDVPKSRMCDVVRAAKKITVSKPVKRNETVLKNVCELGVDLVASCSVE